MRRQSYGMTSIMTSERWCIFWGHDWCEGTRVNKQVVMDTCRWINMVTIKRNEEGLYEMYYKWMEKEIEGPCI